MRGTVWAFIFLLLGVRVHAQDPPSEQVRSDEIRLRAIVNKVVPLASFTGKAIPVHVDPRFALTGRVESVEPVIDELVPGAIVTLAIHSPSELFAGPFTRGGTYDFYLHRRVGDGIERFFDLRVRKKSLTTPSLTALSEKEECAENDEPVGYPLKGRVGYTNTGKPVPDLTVQALLTPTSHPIATTKTDAAGRFAFPSLGPGRFYLKAVKKLADGTVEANDVVTVTKGVRRIACLVAEAWANDQSSQR
jgi:hypothetical protein